MRRKNAAELLKEKISIELNDEIIIFSKSLPYGLPEFFNRILNAVIPELYYADRIVDKEWMLPGSELPMSMEPLLLLYSVGVSPITGYFDGVEFYSIDHKPIPKPQQYQYINLPL